MILPLTTLAVEVQVTGKNKFQSEARMPLKVYLETISAQISEAFVTGTFYTLDRYCRRYNVTGTIAERIAHIRDVEGKAVK